MARESIHEHNFAYSLSEPCEFSTSAAGESEQRSCCHTTLSLSRIWVAYQTLHMATADPERNLQLHGSLCNEYGVGTLMHGES